MPTIMVVDDTASAREMLARLLRREGYQTVTANNGKEALDSLSQTHPDLILLDVAMPELDGLSFLEILHDNPEWRSLPVIMMTAVSDTHCIRRAEQLGAKEYLVKATFSIVEMLDHVRKYTQTEPESITAPN